MEHSFSTFYIAISLFLIMNSVGHIPAFILALKPAPIDSHNRIMLRELCIAFIFMVVFYSIGGKLLATLHIQESAVQISGGIILLLKSLKMIFPNMGHIPDNVEDKEQPFLVPIATPLLVGPSALAAIIVYSSQSTGFWNDTYIGICIAWLLSGVILFLASHIHHLLGDKGVNAAERLMGLVLLLLSIQMLTEGLRSFTAFMHTLPH